MAATVGDLVVGAAVGALVEATVGALVVAACVLLEVLGAFVGQLVVPLPPCENYSKACWNE